MTRLKLASLAEYLPAFLHAWTGKSTELVYLDTFAGEELAKNSESSYDLLAGMIS